MACQNGWLIIVKHLLEKDPSLIHSVDNVYGFTPLHWAAGAGFKELVELLIARGASRTATTRHGFTPLMLAITNTHNDLKTILSPDGSSQCVRRVNRDWICTLCGINMEESFGMKSMIAPLDCGHKFHFHCMHEYLWEAFTPRTFGDGPAELVCPCCPNKLSQEMYETIADQRRGFVRFSVYDAVRRDDKLALERLLEAGGNPNEISQLLPSKAVEDSISSRKVVTGPTFAIWAAGNSNKLKVGPPRPFGFFLMDEARKRQAGYSPLTTAVRAADMSMVSTLLMYGADPHDGRDLWDEAPCTDPCRSDLPLHSMARVDDGERAGMIGIELIRAGAVVNATNLDGQTALDIICENNNSAISLYQQALQEASGRFTVERRR